MPVVITAKKDKFRRCGIAHPAQETEYPNGHFTKGQLAVLAAEPMLMVQFVPAEAPRAKGDAKKEGDK